MLTRESLKWTRDNFEKILAFFVLAVCFTYFFWASFFLTTAQKDFTHIAEIKTAMISIFTLIIGYYFGSSKGSTKKDDVIEQMSDTAKTVAQNTGTGDGGKINGNGK